MIAYGRIEDLSDWNIQKIDVDDQYRREILDLIDRHRRWRAEVQRFVVNHPSILRSTTDDTSIEFKKLSMDRDEINDFQANLESVDTIER